MGYFIESPPIIREIITQVTPRGKYKDLYLTVKSGHRKITRYIIHNDVNYNIEYIQSKINNKLESEDLMISEYPERNYLYITIGCESLHVTGKKLYYPYY